MILRCPFSVLALRADTSHKSEMLTQVLYGERIKYIEETKDWVYGATIHDNYPGWIEKKNFTQFRESASDVGESRLVLHSVLIPDGKLITNYLPFGSIVSEELYYSEPDLFEDCTTKANLNIAQTIDLFTEVMLNVPYLWGGRTVFGIDCSGLTQLYARFLGIQLHRDANQQISNGVSIPFESRQHGDLAFFKKEDGSIIHTGIIINKDQILHASGQVRIDNLTLNGIMHCDYDICTHHLHSIRRIKL